ncbi:hypothetical protein [Paenibacillus qinlingensis]|uniref:Uncharacterized protein n=1 Tax=Paenibacillus qinlingensis TaxID=1837343 RepID=A0ABU1P2M1_9BACL|nr:hypothetical protein [Paenibacillus qinlingensis]MDR6553989.1 hypothetical protein [Paenibacillus qinlingensis]
MASENTTYGVKVSAETKDKITSMIEVSGLSSKVWFERLLALYELQVYKQHEGSLKYLSDIETLQDHTKRIDEIFTSLIKKVIEDNKQYTAEIEKVNLEMQQVVNRLELESKQQQAELSELKHELSESQAKVTRLDDLSISHKETIRCLNVEIDRLKDINASYDLNEIEHLYLQLADVKKDLELSQLRHEKEILVIKDQHNQEIIKLMGKKSSPSDKKLGRPSKKADLESSPSQDGASLEQLEIDDALLSEG